MQAELRYNQAKVNEYRDSAVKLSELRREVEQRFDSAVESGDKQSARDVLAELKASGAAFQELRTTLTPTDLFIAKYNIQVHGPHELRQYFQSHKGDGSTPLGSRPPFPYPFDPQAVIRSLLPTYKHHL